MVPCKSTLSVCSLVNGRRGFAHFFLSSLKNRCRMLTCFFFCCDQDADWDLTLCHDIGGKKREEKATQQMKVTSTRRQMTMKKWKSHVGWSLRFLFARWTATGCYCMCDSFFPSFLFFRSSRSRHALWHLLAWLLLSTNLLLFHATTTSPAGEFEYAGFVDWAGSLHVNNDDCHEAKTTHSLRGRGLFLLINFTLSDQSVPLLVFVSFVSLWWLLIHFEYLWTQTISWTIEFYDFGWLKRTSSHTESGGGEDENFHHFSTQHDFT